MCKDFDDKDFRVFIDLTSSPKSRFRPNGLKRAPATAVPSNFLNSVNCACVLSCVPRFPVGLVHSMLAASCIKKPKRRSARIPKPTVSTTINLVGTFTDDELPSPRLMARIRRGKKLWSMPPSWLLLG